MQMSLGKTEIQLDDRKTLAFRGARDVSVECTEGSVWITIEGNASDYVLAKGERLHIKDNGHGLIQGMPSCSVQMTNKKTNKIPQASRAPIVTFGGVGLFEQFGGLVMHLVEMSNRFLNGFKHRPA